MKISPINIRYNTQTPIPKKTKNTESGLQFELSKYSQTNPVYFSGLFNFKKEKNESEEYYKKLKEISPEETETLPLYLVGKITKPRKMFLDKFFSDERIYNDDNFRQRVNEITKEILTKEQAEYKVKALNVYLDNYDRIQENKLAPRFVVGVRNLRFEPQLDILDFTFSNDEVYKKEDPNNNVADFYMHNNACIEEQPQAEIFKTIVSDKNLYSNQNINCHSILLLSSRYSVPAEAKIQILKRYSQDPELLNDEYLQRSIGSLTYDIQNQHQADLVNKILDHKELHRISSNINVVVQQIKYPEEAMYLDYILDEKRLYDGTYEQFSDNPQGFLEMAGIARIVDSEDEAEAKIKLTKKILDNKILTDHFSRYQRLRNIVYSTKKTKQADDKIALFDKIISNRKLYKNKDIKENLAYLVNEIRYDGDLEKITEIMDLYLANDYLYQVGTISRDLSKIFKETSNKDKHAFVKEVLTNEKLYKNNKFMSNFYKALLMLGYDGYTHKFWNIFNKVLNNKELIENPNVIDNLSKILGDLKYGFHVELVENVLNDKTFKEKFGKYYACYRRR